MRWIASILGVLMMAGLMLPGVASAQDDGPLIIGVSPGGVKIDNALRGGSSFGEFTISRAGSLRAIDVITEVGGNGAEWVHMPEILSIPEGEASAPLEFEIFPDTAPVGTYEAIVGFTIDESGDGVEGGFNIKTGVGARIDFTVSENEVFDVSVRNVNPNDTEVGRPLFVGFDVENTGNILWRPDRAEFTIEPIDSSRDQTLIEVKGKDVPETKPGLLQSIRLRLDHELEEGEYTLIGRFYYRGRVFHRSKALPFTVYKEGHFQQKGELISATMNKDEYGPGENVQVTGVFQNIGALPVEAKLVGELYQGADLLDVIESDPLEVDPSNKGTLSFVIPAPEYGTYKLSIHADYEHRVTKTHELEVRVPEPVVPAMNYTWMIGIFSMLFVLLLLYVFLVSRIRKSLSGVPGKAEEEDDDEYISLPITQ